MELGLIRMERTVHKEILQERFIGKKNKLKIRMLSASVESEISHCQILLIQFFVLHLNYNNLKVFHRQLIFLANTEWLFLHN